MIFKYFYILFEKMNFRKSMVFKSKNIKLNRENMNYLFY